MQAKPLGGPHLQICEPDRHDQCAPEQGPQVLQALPPCVQPHLRGRAQQALHYFYHRLVCLACMAHCLPLLAALCLGARALHDIACSAEAHAGTQACPAKWSCNPDSTRCPAALLMTCRPALTAQHDARGCSMSVVGVWAVACLVPGE